MTQQRDEWLAARFESHRTHLRAVAYRMLGSASEADDAVQESWLRLSRSGGTGIDNLGGWLTTVVARVCLDMLRSRTSRREEPLDGPLAPPVAGQEPADPEQAALLADSVGLALLVVLDSLTPAERVAFVLHDLFAVPFDEIAPIVGRSTDAAKQLASRARRRVQGTGEDDTTPDRRRQREVVEAFLAASRDGDFEALLRLLDPDVVVRADAACAAMGGPRELRGVADVAGFFDGKARAMRLALVDGEPGWVWTLRGQTKVVCRFTVREGKVSGIEMVADEGEVARTELTFLPGLR